MKELLKILETASTNGLTLFIKYFLIAIFITITYIKVNLRLKDLDVPHSKTEVEVLAKHLSKIYILVLDEPFDKSKHSCA